MESLHKHAHILLVLIFFIITYLISGLEKISDWKGNVSFIKKHLSNTLFENHIPFLLFIILVIEFLAVVFMLVGIFHLCLSDNVEFAFYGLELSALTLIFLLIGQRLAKDYQGAMSLTVYFILTIFGLYLLNN